MKEPLTTLGYRMNKAIQEIAKNRLVYRILLKMRKFLTMDVWLVLVVFSIPVAAILRNRIILSLALILMVFLALSVVVKIAIKMINKRNYNRELWFDHVLSHSQISYFISMLDEPTQVKFADYVREMLLDRVTINTLINFKLTYTMDNSVYTKRERLYSTIDSMVIRSTKENSDE